MFVEICKLIMQLYSKNFFKMYFYQSIIKLAHDPVVNVRISFIKILPDLKRIWRLQNDWECIHPSVWFSRTHSRVLRRGSRPDAMW